MYEDNDPPNEDLRKEIKQVEREAEAAERERIKVEREEKLQRYYDSAEELREKLRTYKRFTESEISELVKCSPILWRIIMGLLREVEQLKGS
jgi:hypothetical protein